MASEQPPLCGRVGETAVREALNLDHSERPELVAVRLQHLQGAVKDRCVSSLSKVVAKVLDLCLGARIRKGKETVL